MQIKKKVIVGSLLLGIGCSVYGMNKLPRTQINSIPKQSGLTGEKYALAKTINFYKELDVQQNASPQQINQAYAEKMNQLQSKVDEMNLSVFKQKERFLQIMYLVLAKEKESYDKGLELGIYQK